MVAVTGRARVWDLPVRLFHWLLVLCFALAWLSAEYRRMDLHRYVGYCVLGLVLFRLIWGCVGGHSARFRAFIVGPASVWSYLRNQIWRRDAKPHLGHNPLGGWSVVLMLLLVLTQVSSGLFAVDTDGIESGPLSRFVSFSSGRLLAQVHDWSFNGLLLAVGLHVAAIAYYLIYKKENLVAPMLSGSRKWSATTDVVVVSRGKLALIALITASIVAVAVAALLILSSN